MVSWPGGKQKHRTDANRRLWQWQLEAKIFPVGAERALPAGGERTLNGRGIQRQMELHQMDIHQLHRNGYWDVPQGK